jgi:tetratricopeptide (TPR) repeat protein
LTHSQLRADDSPKLTSTLAICVYEQPGKDRIAKAREILEWELAYASARQRLTANVRALLNLCILSRTENTEFDRDLAFSTIQEKLEVLEARLQSAGKNVERNRVLLAKNLLEAEYLIEKGLCYKSRNHHEEALTFFKQALQPAFVGAELGFRKWLLTSLKWTALGEMEAKRWLQATVYFADYCGRCLFHIEEVVLQQNTPAVYSEAKNHVEKSNAEPRSQLKYFIPGDFVDSFLNLCECLFHLRLYDEANFCVNYISPVALAVDDEEITSRHFELKM